MTAETFLATMERQGVTIAGLARRLGTSRSHLSKAVNGKRAGALASWVEIGHELGLSSEETRVLLEDVPARRPQHGLNSEWAART